MISDMHTHLDDVTRTHLQLPDADVSPVVLVILCGLLSSAMLCGRIYRHGALSRYNSYRSQTSLLAVVTPYNCHLVIRRLTIRVPGRLQAHAYATASVRPAHQQHSNVK